MSGAGGEVPPPTSNALIPTGCLTIQFNSDTVYPEMASDFTG